MSAMPEEALKEVAATNEPPNRLASPEFFFLLQRIDRLDEKLSARIDRVEEKLDNVKLWAIGAVVTLIAGFTGVIIALMQR